MTSTPKCPRCGRDLPADAPQGLCPACLMSQGWTGVSAGQGFAAAAPGIEELRKLFPQLEIVELVGRGGMGAVYSARQIALDRKVALKLLLPAPGRDAAFAERFSREARALARLSHPSIVTIYEFGRAGDYFYFLMELVDGVNLRRLLQAGELRPEQALEIVPRICDALQYAHDEGVVHRDIKPENILLDAKGRVKIADFGLAKLLGPEAAATNLSSAGAVLGTPHYMAPEQVEKPLTVDHRADIYSLGVVFYEMLTGELPLGRFAAPSRLVAVDVRLDDVVLRTLEKEPGRRYQHAREVRTDVESVGHPLRIAETLSDPGIEPDPRRTAITALVPLAAFAALAAVVMFFRAGSKVDALRFWIGASEFGVPAHLMAALGSLAVVFVIVYLLPKRGRWAIWVGACVLVVALGASLFFARRASPFRAPFVAETRAGEPAQVDEEAERILDLRPVEVREVNRALEDAYRDYDAIEQQLFARSLRSRDTHSGRVLVRLDAMPDAIRALDSRLEERISGILDPRQRRLFRDYYSVEKLFPYGRAPARLELWHDGTQYYIVEERELPGGGVAQHSSSGRILPPGLARLYETLASAPAK